jgi:hypothetical protein
MKQRETGQLDPLVTMVFAAVTGIIVLIALVVFVILALQAQTGNRGRETGTNGPFETAVRPLPPAEDLYAIYPPALGPFTLESVSGTLSGGYAVTYVKGSDRVRIAGNLAVSQPAAWQIVADIAKQRGPANRGERFDPGNFTFSYYLDIRAGDVRFAWSRARWVFDLSTTSEALLNEFMAAFAY